MLCLTFFAFLASCCYATLRRMVPPALPDMDEREAPIARIRGSSSSSQVRRSCLCVVNYCVVLPSIVLCTTFHLFVRCRNEISASILLGSVKSFSVCYLAKNLRFLPSMLVCSVRLSVCLFVCLSVCVCAPAPTVMVRFC